MKNFVMCLLSTLLLLVAVHAFAQPHPGEGSPIPLCDPTIYSGCCVHPPQPIEPPVSMSPKSDESRFDLVLASDESVRVVEHVDLLNVVRRGDRLDSPEVVLSMGNKPCCPQC